MGSIASHLASPLRPARGVLIRSVSRRLGSVAYVREDASPNEVSFFNLTQHAVSNPECQLDARLSLTAGQGHRVVPCYGFAGPFTGTPRPVSTWADGSAA